MNVVWIIVDSLRQDHIGAYGNDWIKTPHLDAFAKESIVYTKCMADALPTLQVRRSLHTGSRVYPAKDYGDTRRWSKVNPPHPGWGAVPNKLPTMAEIFQENGYFTGFVTDCYHQFKPNGNFHRGFWNVDFVRGQEVDPYRPFNVITDEQVDYHIPASSRDNPGLRRWVRMCLANRVDSMQEDEQLVARVFRSAGAWVNQTVAQEKFFLVIDSFTPHEPWVTPESYRKLYDPDDDCRSNPIQPAYCKYEGIFTPRELKRIQANYAGYVTLFDRWFGSFLASLKASGRMDDTLVAVVSDHGHCVGHGTRDMGYLSKQGYPATRSVYDLAMMIRHPRGEGAGSCCDEIFYNFDLSRTSLDVAGINVPETMRAGVNMIETRAKSPRDHATTQWGAVVCVRDHKWWYFSDVWGRGARLYDLENDPDTANDVAAANPEICKKMLDRAWEDAGGECPDHLEPYSKYPGQGAEEVNKPFRTVAFIKDPQQLFCNFEEEVAEAKAQKKVW